MSLKELGVPQILSHLFHMLMFRIIFFSSINILNKNFLTALGGTSSGILSLHVRIKVGKLFDHFFFSRNTYMFIKDFVFSHNTIPTHI